MYQAVSPRRQPVAAHPVLRRFAPRGPRRTRDACRADPAVRALRQRGLSRSLRLSPQQKRRGGRHAGHISAIFQHEADVRSEQHEKAWLLRVAVNASKNRLGSAWFRRTEAIDESCPCPEDEDLSFVWDAVRELPPSYREPIHLFYHEGCSTEEIASILQTRPSTIRSRLTRARAMLRDRLKEAYDFDE